MDTHCNSWTTLQKWDTHIAEGGGGAPDVGAHQGGGHTGGPGRRPHGPGPGEGPDTPVAGPLLHPAPALLSRLLQGGGGGAGAGLRGGQKPSGQTQD